MNGKYYSESLNPSDVIEGTEAGVSTPVVSFDPYADSGSVAAAVIYDAPLYEAPAATALINETPVDQALVHEADMGQPLVYKAPVHEVLINEAVMGETLLYKAPSVENLDDEPWVIPYAAPKVETISHDAPVAATAGALAALLNHEESEHFRTRWNEIQGAFVDEPRTAVQHADALVSEVVTQITQMFANEHNSLEIQWNQGNDVSTEDLRKALQHYRSFFNRLVV